jgi:hypothetical protein
MILTINASGAAIILPLYYMVQLQFKPAEHYINLWDAAPLPAAFVIGAVLPGLAMVSSAFLPRSALTHQKILALVQASPLIIRMIQTAGAGLYPIRSLDIRRRRTAALPSVRRALIYSAILSSAAHLTVLAHIVLGYASFTSIYVPNSAAATAAPAATKIMEGAKYFLQWDLIGITLSTALWCYYLIAEFSDMSTAQVALRLVAGNLILGPGATTSMVLSWRESVNNAKAEARRNARLV